MQQPKRQVIEAIKPIFRFIKKEINSGIVLLIVSMLAMIVANSQWAHTYFELFEETKISVDFQIWSLKKPLHYWINDGLMAIFFFMIGLEVKREVMLGELSTFSKAIIPIIAAIGGMVVPALVYYLINMGDPAYAAGWAIPMATDIAFALGILALLGSKAPTELKVFLTSLAIVDDIGAVLTIAVFYTDDLNFTYLFIALGVWALLMGLNFAKVRVTWIYILVGILGVWYPLLLSGVHATIAGVLVAITIPLWRKVESQDFIAKVKDALQHFGSHVGKENSLKLTSEQYDAIEDIKEYTHEVSSPHQRLEHNIHDFTLYFIMPIFAFANTGIQLSSVSIGDLFNTPLSMGIFYGLVLGKVLGIAGFIWIADRLNLIDLPKALSWQHIIGGGFLAGIGFTMSIFITELAFHGDELVILSKVAILSGSILAGACGFFLIKTARDPEEFLEEEEETVGEEEASLV
ncbi:MAG: Na+/H+ antiporter NhaA [Bacteroidota bacterium]